MSLWPQIFVIAVFTLVLCLSTIHILTSREGREMVLEPSRPADFSGMEATLQVLLDKGHQFSDIPHAGTGIKKTG